MKGEKDVRTRLSDLEKLHQRGHTSGTFPWDEVQDRLSSLEAEMKERPTSIEIGETAMVLFDERLRLLEQGFERIRREPS